MHTIRTDQGYEFRARFHWHAEDKGKRHTSIKPCSRQLNRKAGNSFITFTGRMDHSQVKHLMKR